MPRHRDKASRPGRCIESIVLLAHTPPAQTLVGPSNALWYACYFLARGSESLRRSGRYCYRDDTSRGHCLQDWSPSRQHNALWQKNAIVDSVSCSLLQAQLSSAVTDHRWALTGDSMPAVCSGHSSRCGHLQNVSKRNGPPVAPLPARGITFAAPSRLLSC